MNNFPNHVSSESGATPKPGPLNSMSVDVEDWLQSSVNPDLDFTDRFIRNTEVVLEAFGRRGVKGTFFILGLAADFAPSLVREILAEGHEVQSHGQGHRLVHTLNPEKFRQDLERSKKTLEDLTGVEVYGYRAPDFSIGLGNLWALETLVKTGFRYDSSIFPLKTRRYGVSHVPSTPHMARTPSGMEILELPVASCNVFGRRIPTGGGGYFRLFPYPILRQGVAQLNNGGNPAIIYMHPYEYDPFEFDEIEYRVGMFKRAHQGIGRKGFPAKVDRMLSEFNFGTMREIISTLEKPPVHEYCHSDH